MQAIGESKLFCSSFTALLDVWRPPCKRFANERKPNESR